MSARPCLRVREVATGEERWFVLPPRRGVLAVGAAAEDDVVLTGHNLAARHVLLEVTGRLAARVVVRHAWGVRIDGRPPRPAPALASGQVLAIGGWELALVEEPPPASSAIDEAFLEVLRRDPAAVEDRLVYADALEESGRLADATLVRATLDPPAQHALAALAQRTLPTFRRRLLPMPLEACPRPRDAERACPGRWADLPEASGDERSCGTCGHTVVLCGELGTARALALAGRPLALDPAVRRWADDLREPVRRRLAIEMGRPARR